MITRFALFQGRIRDGQDAAFREAILSEVLPEWQAFPGALSVRVNFAEFRDDGAPSIPMILAISSPESTATFFGSVFATDQPQVRKGA